MTTFLIGSSTAAFKARDLLARQGIRSALRRFSQPGGQGCGYALNVSGREEEARALLEEAGIPLQGVRTRGGRP